MDKINSRAWDVLNEDEQLSLNLSYIQEKSTWEAGELMSKAHYKYLEIKYRASHLLRMFTDHFNLYDNFIPHAMDLSPEMAMYLKLTIIKRKKVKETQQEINKVLGYTSKKILEKDITTWLKNASDSDNVQKLNFVNLIKEFDRWNNFRILPKELQEPSAYKRRNKNIYRKHLKAITNMSAMSTDIIVKVCGCKKPQGFFICLINPDGTPLIQAIKKNWVERLGDAFLYVWNDRKVAKEYGDLIVSYACKDRKNCLDGLDFWPKYREITVRAINYELVQKIYPSRRFLEMAVSKLQFYGQENKR